MEEGFYFLGVWGRQAIQTILRKITVSTLFTLLPKLDATKEPIVISRITLD